MACAEVAPKPLFVDPHYHGSCDPEVVWNGATGEWLIYYTGRRALRPEGDCAAACPIGVARSKDWRTWEFAGYCRFDGADDTADAGHTYWAPAVVEDSGLLHMFVTYREGIDTFWGSHGRGIRHYEADAASPLEWRLVGPAVEGAEVIDATLLRAGDRWRMAYRDLPNERHRGVTTFFARSEDMNGWTPLGAAAGEVNDREIAGFGYQEAQYLFRWKGKTWMLTDPSGPAIALYRENQAGSWTYEGAILAEPGSAPSDKSFGRHPSVAVVEGRAFVFYHCEPDRLYEMPYPQQSPENRRCYLQVAELRLEGERPVCDRDAPVVLPAAPRLAEGPDR